MNVLDKLSWTLVILVALTLGLAPFTPEPHIWEKLRMLVAADLVKPVDWFDLVLHGAPWVVLVLKAARNLSAKAG
ncbi:RND transporter [Shimia sediminis]|uniref:RND transporter n=1 Tax=Shimia sediminis TaxID=2497945 RepID=UPI000F8E2F73|nr:RND transporter [Shimia sediminis]